MSTVAKTLRLLEYLKTTSPELGLSRFTALSGYDKASTYRRLTELVNAGFLEQDPVSKSYRLGAAVSRLAAVREQSFPAGKSARHALDRLYDDVRETAHVSVIQGQSGLSTLAHVDDRIHGNRVYIEPADILPFHATASGLVVLAFCDPVLREKVLMQKLEAITEKTETDPDLLRLHIEDARRRGFGRLEGTYETDVFSISAPLFASDGACAGAIAVAMPKARLTPSMEVTITKSLAKAADGLSRAWGGEIPGEVKSAWEKCLAEKQEIPLQTSPH